MINSIRRVEDTDPEAAQVGATETTREITKYKHPKCDYAFLWDLPGKIRID